MKKGFVILSINDQPVSSSNDVEQVLSNTTTAQIGGFYPGNRGRYYYGIKVQ